MKFDKDMDESMKLFKAAQVGAAELPEARRPKRTLLVLDGSSQDLTTMQVGAYLRDELGSHLVLLDARENEPKGDILEPMKDFDGTVLPPPPVDQEGYDAILLIAGEEKCDLLVVPCPYERDFENVGADSTGAVIDVVLAHTTIPVWVVRSALLDGETICSQVDVVINRESSASALAAAWATGLIQTGGSLKLVVALESSAYTETIELMKKVKPDIDIRAEDLINALADAHRNLHTALIKAAGPQTWSYLYDIHEEPEDQAGFPIKPRNHTLNVIGFDRGQASAVNQLKDRICRSREMILVVPG